ncbi:MAG: (2Fe-2S)-binding protein [Gammaproteobacteria bacterium]
MYVCICNGVTERHIRAAVAEGATSFEALQERLEVSTCCGCCEEEVREILADCLKNKPARHLRIVNNNHPAHAA